MRKIIIVLTAATCAFALIPSVQAGIYQAPGAYVGSPSPQVLAIFVAYPAGGAGLIDAIRELLISNPELADDVAFVASGASPAQQQAAAYGMGQAVATLIARGDSAAGSRIVSAATSSGNATLATIVVNAVAGSYGGDRLYSQSANSNPVTTSCTTVSPTGPGGAC